MAINKRKEDFLVSQSRRQTAKKRKLSFGFQQYKLILALLLLCSCQIIKAAKPKPLYFNNSGTFKIVQFTDTHIGLKKLYSEVTIETMRVVLDAEKPDFVIFTGDIVPDPPIQEGYDKLIEPLVTRHIPYIMVFGNHDSEEVRTKINRVNLGKLVTKLPGFYQQPPVKDIKGVTNYVLEIKNSKTKKTGTILYCLDSNDYDTIAGKRGYAGFSLDQVDWYRKISRKYTNKNNGQPIPALAFFHIPLIEYASIKDTSHLYVGLYNEKPCPSQINTGMFAAMLQSGDIMSCFVGHDHDNDYIFNYFGIALGYGRFTGSKNIYTHLKNNGARVIVLEDGKRAFTTWVREKTGSELNVIHYPEQLPFR